MGTYLFSGMRKKSDVAPVTDDFHIRISHSTARNINSFRLRVMSLYFFNGNSIIYRNGKPYKYSPNAWRRHLAIERLEFAQLLRDLSTFHSFK